MNWQWLDMAIGFYAGMVFGVLATIGAIYVGILFKEGKNDMDKRQG